MREKVLVVVLGPHRSGTSALTRALKVLGVELGGDLLPEASDNPKGFFEDIDINDLNEEILRFLKLDWSSLRLISEADIARLREGGYFIRALELLRRKVGGNLVYGLKDPRICILLPLWKEVFAALGARIEYIISVRNPRSVASSLTKRNSINITKGYLLWMSHALGSLVGTIEENPLFVSYDQLVSEPELVIRRIAARLNLDVDSVELSIYLSDFISPGLCHSFFKAGDLDLDPNCPQLAAELYSYMANLALVDGDYIVADYDNKIKKWVNEINRLTPELSLLDSCYEAINNLRICEKDLEGRVSNLTQGLSQKECFISQLQDELVRQNADLTRLRQVVEERDQSILRLTRDMSIADSTIDQQKKTINEGASQIEGLSNDISRHIALINEIFSSKSWRVTLPLRIVGSHFRDLFRLANSVVIKIGVEGGLKRVLSKLYCIYRREGLRGVGLRISKIAVHPKSPDSTENLALAMFYRQQDEITKESCSRLIGELDYKPLVSIIMPVYKTPIQWLTQAVNSIQSQFYDNWELCIVDDRSPEGLQREYIVEASKLDSRIKIAVMLENSGISAASNLALAMAEGEFIALVDHDDELTPDALFRVVENINTNVDFLYSDEAKVDDTPNRRIFDFFFKPDWSPELMLNFMYTGHLTVYRTELVRQIGGFRSTYDFSQDYDLALRMAEVAREIVHIERVLYLWRAIAGSAAAGGKDYARISNIAALNDSIVRKNIDGQVDALPHANRVQMGMPAEGVLVSIVIPSDSLENIRRVLEAIFNGTGYAKYEVILVCNSIVASDLMDELGENHSLFVVRYDKPFNFSDKCNAGAAAAKGDILVFYNDDVFPISPDWMERLIEYLWMPGVGAVSPQLLYEDGTIQYAGMISGTPGLVGTAFHGRPFGQGDEFLSMNRLVRNVSILSGACFSIRRDNFSQIGCFDAVNTPDGHSDVDISYKILSAGYRCVYTPYSVLKHIGNHSWNTGDRKSKSDIFILKRWGKYVSRDPYFTSSMREVLYKDFTFPYKIYAEQVDSGVEYTGPDVLFLSHELTNTGAPHMLLVACIAVKSAGGFPVVVSPCDGPLRKAFQEEGIAVIIDQSLLHDHFLFNGFAKNFDVVLVNTVALSSVLERLVRMSNISFVWWLHESQAIKNINLNLSASELSRVEVICVSEYAKSFLPAYYGAKVVYNGLADHSSDISCEDGLGKFTFLLVGTIEPRKGQDIFVKAIMQLPKEVLSNCRFIMAGKLWSGHDDYWNPIDEEIRSYPEISYLGDVSHDVALSLIAGCNVLVVCSRDDAFPLVAIEAAQFCKPLILSDHVGSREVFGEDCSYLFKSGNSSKLCERLLQAYEDRHRLVEMGLAARSVYTGLLTEEKFGERFVAIINDAQNISH